MKLKMNRKGKAFAISLTAIISAAAGMILQNTQEPQIYYNGSEFREAVAFEMRIDEAAVNIKKNEAVQDNIPENSNAADSISDNAQNSENKNVTENTAPEDNIPEETENTAPAVEENITEETENTAHAAEEVGLININTASAEELMSLKGIGEKLSQRIIAYRTENGGFNTIQDIMKVSGIGSKKFADIKEKITV